MKKKNKIIISVTAVVTAAAVVCTAVLVANRKTPYEKVTTPTGFSEYKNAEDTLMTDADFYVSPSGSDENDGTLDKPFLTPARARDAVRMLDKTGRDGVTVAFMAGEYRINQLEFTSIDGGTEECPVTYCAYGDGEVVFNGGLRLSPSDFTAVTDENQLSRLNEEAQKKVVCTDLTEKGLTADDWGKIYAIGSYNTAAKYDGDYTGGLYCELFVNDARQTIARWPDSGWLYTDEVISTGQGKESNGSLTVNADWDTIRNPESDVYRLNEETAERVASWQTLDNVWLFGFPKYDWADASSPIGNFDREKRTLSPTFVSLYGTKKDAPYYFFNVFEELTAPGEWYLDRESGMLYLYPDDDFSSAEIDLTISSDTLIYGEGVNNLTLHGITVKGTRSDAINLTGDNLTVENCLIKNVAGNALILTGSNNTAKNNEITHTGKGGIYISGGETETLTAGNSTAVNNLIHDWSEVYSTYQPAVTLQGVGNTCAHNEIYNSPHEAITWTGNNHLIEYNLIHDVCLLSDDAGAIYSGRHWDWYGTVIRFNAIYDIGADGHTPDGIYLDDALSGITVYGNLLVNIPKNALMLGGGRDLTVENNIVINAGRAAVSYDQRAIDGVNGGWFNHALAGSDMWTNLFNSPYESEIWQTAYPQMKDFSSDFSDTDNPAFLPNPANSTVSGNILVTADGKIGTIDDAVYKYSTVENNTLLKLSKIEKLFPAAANGDYTLNGDFSSSADFASIPISSIGRIAE